MVKVRGDHEVIAVEGDRATAPRVVIRWRRNEEQDMFG